MTRERFEALCGGLREAVEFEVSLLSALEEWNTPRVVQKVLDSEDLTTAEQEQYYAFLCSEVEGAAFDEFLTQGETA